MAKANSKAAPAASQRDVVDSDALEQAELYQRLARRLITLTINDLHEHESLLVGAQALIEKSRAILQEEIHAALNRTGGAA
jgi:hypothetical protein